MNFPDTSAGGPALSDLRGLLNVNAACGAPLNARTIQSGLIVRSGLPPPGG